MHQTTIIAATDFSDSARPAMARAARIARDRHAGLVLVYAFNDGIWSGLRGLHGELGRWLGEDPLPATRQRLEALADELARDFAIPVEPLLLNGRPAAAIGELAAARAAELVVVGEHGEDWIRDAVIGGTAQKLLKKCGRPVLLVRRPASADYRRVLVAVDFSATSRHAALLARTLFPAAHHYLLHVYAVLFEGRMRLAGALDDDIQRYRADERVRAEGLLAAFAKDCGDHAGATASCHLVHGQPAAALFEQAQAHAADLIVIGRHGGNDIEEQLLGSTTQNVLYHADCDVLLVP